ncbi:MAG: hypothetical protein IJD61_05045 [Clostridia bacterium]|nr:hypothetical protein [Clostridia bacterium]
MKKAALLALAAVCGMFCGCLGAVQADDYIYVVGIGFDRGQQYRYNVSFLIQTETGGNTQSAQGGAEVLSAEGDTVHDAITTLHAGGPFRLNFSRVNTLFFSEELARSGDIRELSDLAFNAMRMRHSVKLMVCMCEAKSLMQGLCMDNSPNITKVQFSVFQNYSNEGITTVTNYSQFMACIRERWHDAAVMLGGIDTTAVHRQNSETQEMTGSSGGGSGGSSPGGGASSGGDPQQKQEFTTEGVIRTGGMSPYISGAALFDGWYMKGVINGEDTRYLLLACGDFEQGNISVPYDDGRWAVLFLRNAKKPRVTLQLGDVPKAQVDIELSCSVLQFVGDTAGIKWKGDLQEKAQTYIEKELERVFEICRSLDSDAMGFGRQAAMKFGDVLEWEQYQWKRRYPDMQAEFEVKLEIMDESMSARLE